MLPMRITVNMMIQERLIFILANCDLLLLSMQYMNCYSSEFFNY